MSKARRAQNACPSKATAWPTCGPRCVALSSWTNDATWTFRWLRLSRSAPPGRRCECAARTGVRAAVFPRPPQPVRWDYGYGLRREKRFDPARVGPASTGLRISIRARLSDAGGTRRSFQRRTRPSARPATEYGVLISDLDYELLDWLQPRTGAYRGPSLKGYPLLGGAP